MSRRFTTEEEGQEGALVLAPEILDELRRVSSETGALRQSSGEIDLDNIDLDQLSDDVVDNMLELLEQQPNAVSPQTKRYTGIVNDNVHLPAYQGPHQTKVFHQTACIYPYSAACELNRVTNDIPRS